ncbi:methyltransferase, FkbM family [compost metagenome]
MILARYGSFFVPADDDLIANSLRLYGEWAQKEIDVLGRFLPLGGSVVDAGAYIGTHTRAFSKVVGPSGHVYSFEPAPSSFSILEQNAHVAEQANIHLFNFGLGSCQEHRHLNLEEEFHNQAAASMRKSLSENSIEVEVRPLDSIGLPHIDFLKVDVEGMEMQLLEGAERTIAHSRPTIFLEVISLSSSYNFLNWAVQHGYAVYGVNVPAFNPDNFTSSVENIFGGAREVGLVLLHSANAQAHQATVEELQLPRIENLDDLAALLLHKPQYHSDILDQSEASKILGVLCPIPERAQIKELQSTIDAKGLALDAADKAYQALRQAYDEKDAEMQRSITAFDAEISAYRKALDDADRAYQALCQAYDEKNAEIQRNAATFDAEISAFRKALDDADKAYQALRQAYDEKEMEMQRNVTAFDEEISAHRRALEDAARAYKELKSTHNK